MFEPTLAGSLPKPGWLAETHRLWPRWRDQGEALAAWAIELGAKKVVLMDDNGAYAVGLGRRSRHRD